MKTVKRFGRALPKKKFDVYIDLGNGIEKIPPAINLDGSPRKKNDLFDYGLNESDAEAEYHAWLWDIKHA